MSQLSTPEQVDLLRSAVSDFFHRLPEVPVYRRRDDPVMTQAGARLVECRALLSQLEPLGDAVGVPAMRAALQAHLEVLELLSVGRVEAAEAPWHRALALEQAAVSGRRLWSRTDEEKKPVYEKDTGASRFDPRSDASVKVKLACPNSACHKVGEFDFSARHATHLFTCAHCKTPFYAYFAELLELRVETRARTHHRYHFRVRELSGETTRVEFDDGGEALLAVAQGDLLAFLYAPRNRLRGVLDLSSSRVLWVRSGGPCFLATAAFGEDAPELDAFREFRDARLLPFAAGRLLVRGYYAVGPALARQVVRHPRLHRLTRRGLTGMHRLLVR